MSYARFIEGDVYVFLNHQNQLECCGCYLQEREWVEDEGAIIGGYLKPVGEIVQFLFSSTQGMVAHLKLHEQAGHHVPEGVIQRLWEDDEENFGSQAGQS